MAFLYRGVSILDNPTPASSHMFSCHNLRLTQNLLHDKDPALAEQLVFLLHKYCSEKPANERRQIEFLLLIKELGAASVARIIADLTAIGAQRLEQPTAQPSGTRPFKQLLDDWIALGDWLVHAAVVDGLSNH
ncbi:hypothetical protein [Gilvimarinus polysaccharolyticus]|uniref:hypothetical protein n=1 Tax=Gilvimarinus polysaccharolyticus TaxID=863921 RepID=UPI00067335C0|nr:hypothetical protein [Gilvimarinus polysaccharolyticus]